MFALKVVDCRICGDPHSRLHFAFVEFADEGKLVVFLLKYTLGNIDGLISHSSLVMWY